MREGDDLAIERARVSRALAVLLDAAVASLMAEYAARMAAAVVCMPGRAAAAAVAALRQERDAALLALRQSHHRQRDRALREIRRRRKKPSRFATRRNALTPKPAGSPARPLGPHGHRP